jgi:hypothetical protein
MKAYQFSLILLLLLPFQAKAMEWENMPDAAPKSIDDRRGEAKTASERETLSLIQIIKEQLPVRTANYSEACNDFVKMAKGSDT